MKNKKWYITHQDDKKMSNESKLETSVSQQDLAFLPALTQTEPKKDYHRLIK